MLIRGGNEFRGDSGTFIDGCGENVNDDSGDGDVVVGGGRGGVVERDLKNVNGDAGGKGAVVAGGVGLCCGLAINWNGGPS